MLNRGLVLAVTAFFTICIAGCTSWSNEDVTETKRRGDIIRVALTEYRLQNGAFPEQLSELVPNFLQEIPLPTVGRKRWRYLMFRGKGGDYHLAVVSNAWTEPDLIVTRDGDWLYDTK